MTFQRAIRIVIGVVLAATALVVGYYIWLYSQPWISLAQTPVEMGDVTLTEPNVLEVIYECGRFEDSTFEVVETPETVTITIETVLRPESCGIGTPIRLDQPLGDRTVIDGFSGEPVEVHRLTERP